MRLRALRVLDHDGRNATTDDDVKFLNTFGRPDIDGADSCPAVPKGHRIAMSSTRAGNLPQSLPEQVALFTAALTDGEAPNFVFDANLDNNSAVALPAAIPIFGNGFEGI